MRIKFITIISIIFCFCLFRPIYAEEEYDISKWKFISLTKRSDQDKSIAISKFYYEDDPSKYAFCIEPKQKFLPASGKYIKTTNDNEYIYEIVKAYDEIGLDDDNYYIAAQILIWEDIEGISYTFDDNDYYEYKQDLLNIVYPKKPIFLLATNENNDNNEVSTNENTIKSYVGEEIFIDEDFSDYNIETDGVSIISNNEDGLKCVIETEEPELKILEFVPKTSDEDKSYVFKSENSQDLYHHEGDYKNLITFTMNLKTLTKPKTFTINYSKKDENNNIIKGAEFSVYAIDGQNDNSEELVFIKNDIDINIFEAILGENNNQNLSIETSERFDIYIDGEIIHTKEIGYFPFKIYENDSLMKQGIVYVTNDDVITNGTYSRIAVKRVFSGFSDCLAINSISNLSTEYSYYLCESEPKKGYIYASEPCVLVNPSTYNGETFEFVNKNRTYTLKLMKQSPEEILLDGAKFKITYNNNGENENTEFVTGSLLINRENDCKYLHYKYQDEENITTIEFEDAVYELDGAKPGKYWFYQSNSDIVNDSLLYENSVNVIQGGFCIENLPYSSSLTIEELVAPKGYIITEPIYHISPDIKYSEITFKNYRINTIDIIPNKFKFPKTCIDEY